MNQLVREFEATQWIGGIPPATSYGSLILTRPEIKKTTPYLLTFGRHDVLLSDQQGHVVRYLIQKRGSPYSPDQMARDLNINPNQLGVVLHVIRGKLKSLHIRDNVTLDNLFVTIRPMAGGSRHGGGNYPADIFLNTQLIRMFDAGLSLADLPKRPVRNAVYTLGNGPETNIKGAYRYKSLVADVDNGCIMLGPHKVDGVCIGEVRLLAVLISRPNGLLTYQELQKHLGLKNAATAGSVCSDLMSRLTEIKLPEGMNAGSVFLRDYVGNNTTEVYLNTAVLDALAAGKSLDRIRTQHWGKEFMVFQPSAQTPNVMVAQPA